MKSGNGNAKLSLVYLLSLADKAEPRRAAGPSCIFPFTLRRKTSSAEQLFKRAINTQLF